MIGLVLGVVLTVVLKAIWSWQGENIKKWGGRAWKVARNPVDVLFAPLALLAFIYFQCRKFIRPDRH
jgi:hypothetical protein